MQDNYEVRGHFILKIFLGYSIFVATLESGVLGAEGPKDK